MKNFAVNEAIILQNGMFAGFNHITGDPLSYPCSSEPLSEAIRFFSR